jgi:hypothetical protein
MSAPNEHDVWINHIPDPNLRGDSSHRKIVKKPLSSSSQDDKIDLVEVTLRDKMGFSHRFSSSHDTVYKIHTPRIFSFSSDTMEDFEEADLLKIDYSDPVIRSKFFNHEASTHPNTHEPPYNRINTTNLLEIIKNPSHIKGSDRWNFKKVVARGVELVNDGAINLAVRFGVIDKPFVQSHAYIAGNLLGMIFARTTKRKSGGIYLVSWMDQGRLTFRKYRSRSVVDIKINSTQSLISSNESALGKSA